MPVIVPLLPFLRRRLRRAASAATPAPPDLVLASAYYDDTGEAVYLVFDRPVDVAAFAAGAAIVVRDGTFNGHAYQGQGATLEDPTTARVQLVVTGPYGGGSVELLATAGSGIAAADDGGTWPGTVATGGVTLPYP